MHMDLMMLVSLSELKAALAQDLVFTQLHSFICEYWLIRVPEGLMSFHGVKNDPFCWNDVCVVIELYTVVLNFLRECEHGSPRTLGCG